MTDVESYKSGYRAGFEAGRASELQKVMAAGLLGNLRDSVAGAGPRRAPLPPERKCDCGHADRTHNDLGYCQAKDRSVDRRYADQCPCRSFENDYTRAASMERGRAR